MHDQKTKQIDADNEKRLVELNLEKLAHAEYEKRLAKLDVKTKIQHAENKKRFLISARLINGNYLAHLQEKQNLK